LLCFDLGSTRSLKNIKEKYLKELYENRDHVFGFNPWKFSFVKGAKNEIIPMVLIVGCKSDLRKQTDENVVIPKVTAKNKKKMKKKTKKKKEQEKQNLNKNENKNVINWEKIPNELMLDIFTFLDVGDLGRVACVCKRWKEITDDESLGHWQQKKTNFTCVGWSK